MTHQEMIDVIQAHKDDKVIEAEHKNARHWEQCKEPNWNFHAFNYRVKPEPRRFWINVYPNTNIYMVHPSSQAAAEGSKGMQGETIEVVEVLNP